jgi:hypothetical protein
LPVIPAVKRLEQEAGEFKASLDSTARQLVFKQRKLGRVNVRRRG